MSGFNLSRESFDKDYAQVADGVYTVSERHKAGGASFFPDMNNHGFIYHVTNEFGVKHLLLNGIPGPSCIPKVQKIEKDTGLELTLIVLSGDFHHMAIKNWLDASHRSRWCILHSSSPRPEMGWPSSRTLITRRG